MQTKYAWNCGGAQIVNSEEGGGGELQRLRYAGARDACTQLTTMQGDGWRLHPHMDSIISHRRGPDRVHVHVRGEGEREDGGGGASSRVPFAQDFVLAVCAGEGPIRMQVVRTALWGGARAALLGESDSERLLLGDGHDDGGGGGDGEGGGEGSAQLQLQLTDS